VVVMVVMMMALLLLLLLLVLDNQSVLNDAQFFLAEPLVVELVLQSSQGMQLLMLLLILLLLLLLMVMLLLQIGIVGRRIVKHVRSQAQRGSHVGGRGPIKLWNKRDKERQTQYKLVELMIFRALNKGIPNKGEKHPRPMGDLQERPGTTKSDGKNKATKRT
jgi:hypothetical protein